MKTFAWNQNYITGLETVDEQHQYLVDIINRLGDQVSSKQSLEPDELEDTFNSLAEYASYHFDEEEQLMVTAGIDSRHLVPHRAEHQQFIVDATEIYERTLRGDLKSDDSLLQFLVHWLTYHILGQDQLMAKQIELINTGIGAAEAYEKGSVIPEGTASVAALFQAVTGLIKEVRKRNVALTKLNRSLEDEVHVRTLDLEKKLKGEQELSSRLEESTRLLQKSQAEAKEGEQRFKDFASVSSDWFWEMDVNLRFSYFSSRLQQATGMDPQKLLGQTRKEIGLSNVTPENWEAHFKTLDNHEPFTDFIYSTRHDGKEVWLSVSGVPVFDSKEQFLGYRGTGNNITAQKNKELTLQENDRKLRFLIEQHVDGILIVDDSRIVRFANQAASFICYHNKHEFIGEYVGFSFDDEQEVEIETIDKKVIVEVRSIKTRWEGESAWLVLLRDVTQRKKDELEIRRLHSVNERILSSITEGLLGVDSAGTITFANQAAERLSGWTASELLGKEDHELLHHTEGNGTISSTEKCQAGATTPHNETHSSHIGVLQARDGINIPVEITRSPITDDGEIVGALVAVRDVTARRKAELAKLSAQKETEQALDKITTINLELQAEVAQRRQLEGELRHQASYDQLTDLPNRTFLTREVNKLLAYAKRHKHLVGFMFIDINKFKPVNDTYGHAMGNAVLVEISSRIRDSVRDSDIVCRIGGDEFLVLLPAASSTNEFREIAIRIAENARRPMDFIADLCMSVSIGIAVYPDDADNKDGLIRLSDEAMYRAKSDMHRDFVFSKDT